MSPDAEKKIEYSYSLCIIVDRNMIWSDMKAENLDFSDFRSVWYPRRDSLRLTTFALGKLTFADQRYR